MNHTDTPFLYFGRHVPDAQQYHLDILLRIAKKAFTRSAVERNLIIQMRDLEFRMTPRRTQGETYVLCDESAVECWLMEWRLPCVPPATHHPDLAELDVMLTGFYGAGETP